MHDDEEQPIGPIARLLADPIRLRRWGRIALALATPLAGFAHGIRGGTSTGWLVALVWVVMPFIALAIAVGDAFFLQYGRSRRRVTLTLAAAVGVALASCVVLAIVTEEARTTQRQVVEGVGYAVLYLASTSGLASLIALILGVGREYVSDRIMRMSRDDW
jgi:formate hydrogenlyase subunit 3/multisubunit Na+/H+ antiporter MnhD subunit